MKKGQRMTIKQRERLSQLLKGRKAWNKGIPNTWYNPKGLELGRGWNKGTKGIMKPNKTSFKKGEHRSPNTEFKKGEMSEKMKGEKNHSWKGGKPKCRVCNKKLDDYRSKICKSCLKMENHPGWLGGKSFEEYGENFKSLREKIRQRDGYRCQECFRHQDELFNKSGKKYKLSVHHIDFNKKNDNENNLISLCRSCHLQTNYNRENWINYFKTKIYAKIN